MSGEGRSTARVLFGLVAWLCAAGGSLRVADIPGEYSGSMCGVWGCYPPLQALIAMHLFWCVVMIPVVWALARFCPHRLRQVGIVMAVGAGLATAGVVGWVRWSPDESRPHWPKRALYTLLTKSDVPLIQTILAGVACFVMARKPNPTATESRPEGLRADADEHV